MVVVEQTGRIGGRLHSTDSDGDGASDHHDEANKDELGGMRIFPSAGMEKVRKNPLANIHEATQLRQHYRGFV